MKRVALSRRGHVDLLRFRPTLDAGRLDPASERAVRRIDQVRALLHLVDRGVLSQDEFERQEGKLFRRPTRYDDS